MIEMGINLAADALERNIREVIRGSGCPAVIVCGVLRDVLTDATAEKQQAIKNELQDLRERQKASLTEKTEHKGRAEEDGKPAETDHENRT